MQVQHVATKNLATAFSQKREREFAFFADFISLTKPGVMLLLLVSTVCPMFVAVGGLPEASNLLFVLLGGALVSGSASALNCVWDWDIDTLMERTKQRPIPAQRLSPASAIIFSFLLGLSGLLILAYFINPLAAAIALAGHAFYVFIYTIWLKRSTPQNIVIGGAAGAVPPLVGWAAATGSLDLTAVLLFLIIFLWTPPHFWALALNKNADYQRASVPMLPVIFGEHETHKQMFFYSLTLLPVSFWLVVTNQHLGWFSLLSFTALGLIFSYKIFQLKQIPLTQEEIKAKKAWNVFGFSLVYLSLFFVCLVVDSLLI